MKPIAILLVMSVLLGAGCSEKKQSTTKPADEDVIAVVLGKNLTVEDKDKLNGLIFGPLLEQFAKDNKIEPVEEELDAFTMKMEILLVVLETKVVES